MSENNLVYVDLRFTPKPENYDGPRWQPWSIMVLSGENFEDMFKSTERYTNEADARNAIAKTFGPQAIVYLRAPEKGNELVRHPEPWPADGESPQQ